MASKVDDLLARAKLKAHWVTHEELVARGLAAFEDAGFSREQIDDVAGMVGWTAEDLACSIATASPVRGSPVTKADQPSGPVLEKINRELEDIRRLLVAQRSSELVQEWYTVPEAAELTGLRPFTLRQACNLGRIREDWRKKDIRTGKWRVHRDAITWIRNHGLPPLSR
jgi:hypothetical protein